MADFPFNTGVEAARIWLSASIPDPLTSTAPQREAVEQFVVKFAREVFRVGGHIVHGSHPTLVALLLREAAQHQQSGGRNDCLTLVVSQWWVQNERLPIDEWRRHAVVYETPAGPDRESSLRTLREWIVARSDAAIFLGGRWWEDARVRAGVPTELGLAVSRGLPSFLLGGFGGAATEYVRTHPQVLEVLKNGLTVDENARLAHADDVAGVAIEICQQLARLPLVRAERREGTTFRILALDGGGIKGTFSAAALATWEQQTNRSIVDHFDLIAGTSTGGILAIGLGLGLSAAELLKFYREQGPAIFPVTGFRNRWHHTLRHFFAPKFSQQILLSAIEAAYYKEGKLRSLKDSKCMLVIPAFHALGGASHTFRTPHHPNLTGDAARPAALVALATASAPTYFAAAKISDSIAETEFFDGGVWANNPAMAAIVEAVCYLKVPLDRIDVLSVGTTEEPYSFNRYVGSGKIGWGFRRLLSLLMTAQEDGGLKHAKLLAGEPRFLRVNAVTPSGAYELDDSRDIEQLASLGQKNALEPEVLGQVRSRFLNGVTASRWTSFAVSQTEEGPMK